MSSPSMQNYLMYEFKQTLNINSFNAMVMKRKIFPSLIVAVMLLCLAGSSYAQQQLVARQFGTPASAVI